MADSKKTVPQMKQTIWLLLNVALKRPMAKKVPLNRMSPINEPKNAPLSKLPIGSAIYATTK